MAKSVFVAVALLVPMLPGHSAEGQNENQHSTEHLWAAITGQQPIFFEGGTDALQIKFCIFNDGPSAVNPRIESSYLSINGVKPKDWRNVIINGLRNAFLLLATAR